MNAAHYDSLVHTLHGHSEQKESSYFNVTWKIDENFTQSCNFRLVVLFRAWWRDCQSTCLLEIFEGIADIAILRWLDSSTQNLLRFICSPQLDLENEFLKRAPLHFRLRILRYTIVVEALRAHSKDEAICNTTSSSCPLFRRGFGTILKLETFTLADRIIMKLFGQHEIEDVFDVRNSDGTFSYVGRNNAFTLPFHHWSTPESPILLFLAERRMQWNHVDMVRQPLQGIEVLHKLDEFKDLM